MNYYRMLLALVCLLCPLTATALDTDGFSRIPILQDGRIKPLGSFARVLLKQCSDKKSLPGDSAYTWLAGVLFAPLKAMDEKLFIVRSPSVVSLLGLPQSAERIYSFSELSDAFGRHQGELKTLADKDPKLFNADERELADLYAATKAFAETAGAFSLLLPLPDVDLATRRALHLKETGPIDYLDLLKAKDVLMASLTETVRQKGEALEHYTPQEARYAKLAFTMHLLETLDRESNALLRVIPPAWQGDHDWLSPWAVIREGKGSPHSARLFAQWQALAIAYQAGDDAAWKTAAHALLQEGNVAEGVRPWALTLETLYNQAEPLQVSLLGYGLALIILAAGWLRPRWPSNRFAYGVMAPSALLHLFAILARMAILSRPPVSTLYESMIFVSLVIALLGLWMERKAKNAGSLGLSSAISAFLLIAADRFAGSSDTLEVLVAVLNTNFWLATHVVCITTGYSTALLTGALAHLYLFKRAMGRADAATLAAAHKRIYHAALVALLFTAVGTMLGGIWADQSWGRFWGWDPKENGALWIVLWLIWLLHGRLAGQLRELGVAITAALITIVVALAWVGVNLLGVGLHSYGFTNAAATGLIGFCAVELLVITLLVAIIIWCPQAFNLQRSPAGLNPS